MTRWILGAATFTLTACNSAYREPELAIDHPANPAAAAALPPDRSHALAPDATMHAEQTATAPATVPASTSGDQATAAYACPMHPQIISDKPDQRCPECGMKLVARSEVDDHR